MLYTEHYYPTLAGIFCLILLFFNPFRIKIAFKTLLLFNTLETTLVFGEQGDPSLPRIRCSGCGCLGLLPSVSGWLQVHCGSRDLKLFFLHPFRLSFLNYARYCILGSVLNNGGKCFGGKGAFKYYISAFGGVWAKMLTLLTLWRGGRGVYKKMLTWWPFVRKGWKSSSIKQLLM